MGYLEQIESANSVLDPWCIYLYGEPGCGKTVLACRATAPLLIQVDRNGRRSLRNHLDTAEIPTIQAIDSRATVEGIVREIKRNPGGEYDKFKTIVADTWSRLQEVDREEIEKKLPSGRKGLSEFEYKENNSNMTALLHLLHSTGKNIILVAHETEVKDNEGMTILIRPRNSEVTMGNVFAQTDAVFYMSSQTKQNGETTRKLRVLSTNKIKAKNRFGSLPAEITDPDYNNLWKLIESEGN